MGSKPENFKNLFYSLYHVYSGDEQIMNFVALETGALVLGQGFYSSYSENALFLEVKR